MYLKLMKNNNISYNFSEIINKIKSGKIFIYLTDTIYGIGCDATKIKAVDKIKTIKNHDKDNPLFSNSNK